MSEHAEISPQRYARVGGLLYLVIIVTGGFSELFVRDKLEAAGNAAATAANIMASESLWRIALASDLILLVCAVGLTLIFYVLLKPVSRNIALLAVLFNLVSIAIEGMCDLCHVAALPILGDYLKTFEPSQRAELARLSLRLFDYGYGISLVFFGVVCLILGYLLFKSRYFPRFLGVLMVIAGVSYLTNSFALFLSPALEARLFPTIVMPAGISELTFCLWLIIMGVNVQRWNERAAAAPS